jgi:hypothetical protein
MVDAVPVDVPAKLTICEGYCARGANSTAPAPA